MREFAFERPSDTRQAVELLEGHPDAAYLAGGTNLVDHMKLGVRRPKLLVDVGRLPLGGIEERDGGIRIGAGVRNSELAAHPVIRERYPVLARALLAGASPQLRNLATTAGNLLQRTRCVYFQDVTTPCNKRDPGSGCSAHHGHTRYHAILGASEHCIAVHPSDMAVAMMALDARLHVQGRDARREIALDDFYRTPGATPERDTTLEHGELITAVVLPGLPMARNSTYLKVRDRASYAFALVSVAAAVEVRNGHIEAVRIALGGVAHKPWRARSAERALQGVAPSREAFLAAAAAELADAKPQRDNAFKVPMARNAIAAILEDLTREAQ
jgi:xanthine dehydrogenase YagS FAD-binding subunit